MRRTPRSSRARATVLVLTILVVVVAAAVVPVLLRAPGATGAPEYSVGALVPERAPAEGTVELDRREESGVVLVDMAHGNRMEPDEMEPLLAAITSAGYQVDLLESGDDFDASLAAADAFVVIDPNARYTEAEANRVGAFVDRGGRLLLVGEPTTLEAAGFSLVVHKNRLTSLSSQFGFEFGEAYLFNMRENDGNHLNVFAEPERESAITEGVSRTALYTTTRLNVREGVPLLVASDGTRSSRTDATGSYPVAAVNGDVLAIADGSFLQHGNFNVHDNELLVRNVARFLVSGSKDQTIETYPAFVGDAPTVHYTGPALLRAAQRVGSDLRADGRNPRVELGGRNVNPDNTDVLVTTFDYLAQRGELGTGIRATDRRVRVPGYESNSTGIIVVRAPESGYDLVIAADTPGRAERAAALLGNGELDGNVLDGRTAVVRTNDAIRLVPVGG